MGQLGEQLERVLVRALAEVEFASDKSYFEKTVIMQAFVIIWRVGLLQLLPGNLQQISRFDQKSRLDQIVAE